MFTKNVPALVEVVLEDSFAFLSLLRIKIDGSREGPRRFRRGPGCRPNKEPRVAFAKFDR
jgi:hypothetical protein